MYLSHLIASATSTATTTAEKSGDSNPSSWPSLIILLLIPLGAYFLLIRPQKRRQKQMANMQSTIEIGD